MLVVKVEIWPLGDKTAAKELGLLYIANIGTDESGKAKYIASEQLIDIHSRISENLIEIPSHTRSRGFWPLIKQVVTKLVHKKGL